MAVACATTSAPSSADRAGGFLSQRRRVDPYRAHRSWRHARTPRTCGSGVGRPRRATLGAIPAAERAPNGDDHQTLIFDWDGTLVDPRALNHRALEAAPRDRGVTLDPGWY